MVVFVFFRKIWFRLNSLTKNMDTDYVAEMSIVGKTKCIENITQSSRDKLKITHKNEIGAATPFETKCPQENHYPRTYPTQRLIPLPVVTRFSTNFILLNKAI